MTSQSSPLLAAPASDCLTERRVLGNNVHRNHLVSGCARTPAIETLALRWCQGKGVDFGYGDSEAYPSDKNVEYILPGAIGIDMGTTKYPSSSSTYSVAKNDSISATQFPEDLQELDYIFSSHCLEHIQDWKPVLTYWHSCLKKNGILFLYLPHESVAGWRPENIDSHVWKPTIEDINPFLRSIQFSIVEYMVGCDSEGSFYIIAQK